MKDKEYLLIKRAQKGDADAFSQLAENYQRNIYNLAFRFLGNPHDAADAAQEAFIKAYSFLKGFRNEAAFSTWLYRIAVNVCLDFLREKKRMKEISLEEIKGGENAACADNISPLPEQSFLNKESGEILRMLIAELPPEYYAVIILRENQGLSYEEISKCLKISQGTVKSRLSRGREILRKKILQNREHYPYFSSLKEEKAKKG
jgi:RNA polymerase sigma-70 factor (ECF subfamily)